MSMANTICKFILIHMCHTGGGRAALVDPGGCGRGGQDHRPLFPEEMMIWYHEKSPEEQLDRRVCATVSVILYEIAQLCRLVNQ
jgi:hypothetical protein